MDPRSDGGWAGVKVMMRLVRQGLMFGNLIEVSSEALVSRYNRALKHLIGKETKLTEFHVDICGYSPEIGDEFDDELYLNPKGCNQQFILLSPDQKTAPLISSKFSTSREILRDFIEDNEEELFALTAREAVTGELVNSVFEVEAPSDLLRINQISIEADTVTEHIAFAQTLQEHINRFMKEDDAWWDDVLIADMIELAKTTGDITRHPIQLSPKTYEQGNYHTSHFGGMYIFRDMKKPAVIAKIEVEGLADMKVDHVFTFANRREIAEYLYRQNLIELIVTEQNEDDATIIQQKLDFIVIATAAELGDDLGDLSRPQIRAIARKYADQLPEEYFGLMEIHRWASHKGRYPSLDPDHPGYFYAFRSKRHRNRDLVNMLLAELSPLDFRQLFICHKQAFYDTYRTWSDPKREFVSRFLAEEYMMDKEAARETLFGPEPSMDNIVTKKDPRAPRRKVRYKT
ncbi:MAG: hypothetical protein HKN36_12575 [Hellea sp.]|nr:hypothetical protein [Hellea sp.]